MFLCRLNIKLRGCDNFCSQPLNILKVFISCIFNVTLAVLNIDVLIVKIRYLFRCVLYLRKKAYFPFLIISSGIAFAFIISIILVVDNLKTIYLVRVGLVADFKRRDINK